jgi:hypothetical protein
VGTPVLVFAALGFIIRMMILETIGRFKGKYQEESDVEMGRDKEGSDENLRDIVGPTEEIDPEKYRDINGRSFSLA